MKRRALTILISSGPTREPIDPVRFISNYSSGYMGSCLAEEAIRRGHKVVVVSGPSEYALPKRSRCIKIQTARQMQSALKGQIKSADAIIMAAAVCDFYPEKIRKAKISRKGNLSLRLKATPDILASLPRKPGQVFAGFALETQNALSRSKEKLKSKRLDLIVAQDASAYKGPFGENNLRASIVSALKKPKKLGMVSKKRLSSAILDEIEQLCYGEVL
jgi:phosphopantothenoylcysteine decarboxylase / phosphopantothenate---cysteine ligase